MDDGDFTAHALLAAVRADLVEYLAGDRGLGGDELRARLAAFTARVLGAAGADSASAKAPAGRA